MLCVTASSPVQRVHNGVVCDLLYMAPVLVLTLAAPLVKAGAWAPCGCIFAGGIEGGPL